MRLPRHDHGAKLTDFGQLLEPGEAKKPILAKAVSEALDDWITEIRSEEELAWAFLKPRKKALFTGPPGVGKTTLAWHLGARLKVRMIAVRPEGIIDCWVGSSSRNLATLFDLAAAENAKQAIILFFDEFDALAAKRIDGRTGADLHYNEMVNTLLQRMESHSGFLIAATNFADKIDQAIFRRFELQIALQSPGRAERRKIFARYLAPYGLPMEQLDALSMSFEGAMPELIQKFAEGLKREIIVGPKTGKSMQKEAVVERIIVMVKPHPDLPSPRLWSQGAKDQGVRVMQWPLPVADSLPKAVKEDDEVADSKVVRIGSAR